MSVRLIEEPEFRLAGAEEAIRQVVASVEQILQHQEPLARELARKAAEAYGPLQAFVAAKPAGRRQPLSAGDVVELLRGYPKWRFQSLVLQQASSAFLSLRGHLSDELREINFCRVRLAELQRLLDAPPDTSLSEPARGGWCCRRAARTSGRPWTVFWRASGRRRCWNWTGGFRR